MAIRNERTAICRILGSSASRVRCAKGPTILSGPNITKSSVKIWPYESQQGDAVRGALHCRRYSRSPTLLDLAIEEKAQERADRRDHREASDFVPCRRHRRVDDVGRELERKAGHEPARETPARRRAARIPLGFDVNVIRRRLTSASMLPIAMMRIAMASTPSAT